LEDLEPVLRCYVGRRCGNALEVDDIVQETLLRAARYRRTLLDPVCLRGWALSIACNVIRDVARRETRLPRADIAAEAFEQLEGRESEPGHVAEDSHLALGALGFGKTLALEHISSAMHDMRCEDRRLLRSYYWGDRDCARAARECGIPVSVAKVRLFRARQRLTRVLRRRFLGDGEPRAAGLRQPIEAVPCRSAHRSRSRCSPRATRARMR
jgi:RNA polymerase sigma factor (sigma-70 family)